MDLATDPTAGIEREREANRSPDVLTVDELARLLAGARTPKDRAVISLLSINAVRLEELHHARIADLGEIDGQPVLRIPGRSPRYGVDYTVLPEITYSALREYLGDRRRGPLIIRQDGQPLDRHTINRIVKRAAKRAGLPKASALTLRASVRAIAIENGFSYLSVIRSVGELDLRRLVTFVRRAPNPVTQHAAMRLARLLAGTTSTARLLEEANLLVRETDAPAAVAAGLAGASLERHLRVLAREQGVTIPRGEGHAKLTTYLAALRGAGVLDEKDVQVGARIAKHRDDGAHGWFGRVTADDATWAIEQAHELAARHPVTATTD